MLTLDKTNRNKTWLTDHYFRYMPKFSGEGETVYLYTFPVWKAGDIITLEAHVMVTLETGETTVDVYDTSFRGKYAPYYLEPPYYEPLLQEIHKKIDAKLKFLQISDSDKERDGIPHRAPYRQTRSSYSRKSNN